MQVFNENLLHLHPDPRALGMITGTLPATIYGTETMSVNGKLQTRFAFLPCTLETGDAERIAMDHAAELSVAGEALPGERESACKWTADPIGHGHSTHATALHLTDASAVVIQINNQRGAIIMLWNRVCLLRDYVYTVKDGKISANAEMLREIAAAFRRLPVIEEGDN